MREASTKRTATIFYSWQSDLPGSTNRSFIQEALEQAVKALKLDDSVEVDPALDRDTQGQVGAVQIADTILAKIDRCDVFVADVSIIGAAAGRPVPNPNVLFELGRAFNRPGERRVVMVMNTAYGGENDLPFDLCGRRVLSYAVTKEGTKADGRRQLARSLEDALRPMLADVHASTPVDDWWEREGAPRFNLGLGSSRPKDGGDWRFDLTVR
jgi:hypothetical protein